jgi:redox-sensing transcriptional repressor
VEVKGEKISIYHLDSLESFLKNNRDIRIAMLAVPENAAQEVLDKLIKLGIKGIVNFAPRILKLPGNARNIQLVNDCIGDSLYKIVYQTYHKS